MDTFKCRACGRTYRWMAEISGRSVRCKCGQKVRCPAPGEGSRAGDTSLEDTVADVQLEEHLDQIETGEGSGGLYEPTTTQFRRIPQRGVFGWSMGRTVLFWSALSVVGLALGILAAIMREHYLPYSIAFLLVAPYSWWQLYRAWPRWTQGRPWFECLAEGLGEKDDTDARTPG